LEALAAIVRDTQPALGVRQRQHVAQRKRYRRRAQGHGGGGLRQQELAEAAACIRRQLQRGAMRDHQ
jgi:hypothetical protein